VKLSNQTIADIVAANAGQAKATVDEK